MREIKFRAWDKELKKMTKWEDLILDKSEKNDGFLIGWKENECITSFDYEQDLMQYTGFNDRNGKEIYERDILSGDFYYGGAGWFDTGEGHYKLENEIVEFEDGSFRVGGFYLSDVGYDIKIVGNIYENADLLEVEE